MLLGHGVEVQVDRLKKADLSKKFVTAMNYKGVKTFKGSVRRQLYANDQGHTTLIKVLDSGQLEFIVTPVFKDKDHSLVISVLDGVLLRKADGSPEVQIAKGSYKYEVLALKNKGGSGQCT